MAWASAQIAVARHDGRRCGAGISRFKIRPSGDQGIVERLAHVSETRGNPKVPVDCSERGRTA